jgi:putative FmdB family regulatory protein
MPIYEYRCEKCGKIFEELVLGTGDAPLACPECGTPDPERLLSGFCLGEASAQGGGGAAAGSAGCGSGGFT